MPIKRADMRDFVAFWIFGLSNNFAYVIMLSAAEDIMSQQTTVNEHHENSTSKQCQEVVKINSCEIGSLGAVLLADVLPSLFIKLTFPFFMHRIPFVFRHCMVCLAQALSYLIVAFSVSVPMSLLGVVFASIGSGLGEISYLSLASYYSSNTISAWSSGTGGAGIFGALAYAGLTEPHFANLSPRTTLLVMLVVPLLFLLTYFTILTSVDAVYKPRWTDVRTWLVPHKCKEKVLMHEQIQIGEKSKPWSYDQASTTTISTGSRRSLGNEKGSDIDLTLSERLNLILPLLKFIIPLAIVYYAEYLINQGLTAFLVFDCSRGFGLSKSSQYRWYQVLYQLGVFISRSSVNFIQLPFIGLMMLPILQCMNAIFFFFDAIYFIVPHIWITFVLIFFEGLFGGAAYVNTFYKIHRKVHPSVKEFSLGIASVADTGGIVLSGFSSLPIHNYICRIHRR
ncbi:Battenin [Aphelenchoides bicaudatus]|nr:Battenin [Aphelenchoides bicaudatus]